ncbi:MAG: EamA family transporter [Verrucomicrobia bacterium]|nr:EamA family transporter [Verrucomicrobiota bacterium]
MNQTDIVVLAVVVAASMALLVRAGVNPSLRAAIRTTVVLVLGWGLAYVAERPVAFPALSWRVWLMLALSVFAAGQAWWLHFRAPKLAEPASVAAADRINVFVAAAFALLLLLSPSARQYGVGALLVVTGAIVLALNRR